MARKAVPRVLLRIRTAAFMPFSGITHRTLMAELAKREKELEPLKPGEWFVLLGVMYSRAIEVGLAMCHADRVRQMPGMPPVRFDRVKLTPGHD